MSKSISPHPLPAFDPATLQYYAESAPIYTASGPGGRNRHLDRFLDGLAPKSYILDAGCGGGLDARAMLDRGFVVDAIEASPAIAATASKRLGQSVAVRRFDEIDGIDVYDAVWASASLIHIPRPALPGVLAQIFRALKPGGLHFATYKSGGQEGRDGAGRYYNYPSLSELRAFYLSSAPWKITAVDEYISGGFDNGTGPWLVIETVRPHR